MASLDINLQRLSDARDDIADAITAKGGTVSSLDGFEDFPADIRTINANITSANVTAMTGYEIASIVDDIETTDTLNEAIGKLEKGVETNRTNISLKQDIIDSSHKLDADLVDDSTATNKFATAAQLSQIATNTSNIAQKIGASDYATQNTGGTVRAWTTTDGTSTTLHIATEAPSP